jgi:hypothetical protein
MPAIAGSDFQLPVDERFGGGTIDFPGYGKGYVYRMMLTDRGGQIAVCGAGYFPDASNAIGVRRLMRKAEVLLNGRKVVRDLSFFSQVRSEAALEGAPANCTQTGFPTPKSGNVEVDVNFPSGFVRF